MSTETAAPDDAAALPVGASRPAGTALEVLAVAARLGLTSFGGPVAHLGYFRDEYVVRRQWIDDATFADLVALSQTLPGPASSKLGISIGILRAGLPGGLAAWLGFTLPSALILILFALFVQGASAAVTPWLVGLKIAAVAVVAQALWGMARTLAWDARRGAIAIIAAIVLLVLPAAVPLSAAQLAVIVAAGMIGWRILPAATVTIGAHVRVPVGRSVAVVASLLFFALLVGLPLLRSVAPGLLLFDSFYRVGALVFGGGHVVLPLLEGEVVAPGWVSQEQFLIGYGAAQAVPGPLFTLAAYLGAVRGPEPNGVAGALIALVAIFLPGFLIVLATLPSWGAIRTRPAVQSALRGINAAVVGLLLAALYQSVWLPTIKGPADFALALAAFGLLVVGKAPPWLVVLLTALAGALLFRGG